MVLFSVTERLLGWMGWWQDFKYRINNSDDEDGDVYDNNGGDDGGNNE